MTSSLAAFDWVVIVAYAVGMLVVGWYFSRRTRNTDDYMLGGRNMKPWAVGMSLFATLLSAISYLAAPGEMIKYGPMLMCGLAAIPFVYGVVGWLLIPTIMKLRVASAYEILEVRLGVSLRVLASILFLTMRLVWMSVIIYMCSVKVIVPIMGWSSQTALAVSMVMGVVTIAYTSMGGLRAVVATDVVQTLILLGAAVLTIAMIARQVGGFTEIIPSSWPDSWLQWRFWSTEARASFFTAMIAYFSWYVCTAGSDQMAIQRYLATRDPRGARQVFLTTLVCDAVVGVFLGLVGLALLAFFTSRTDLLPAAAASATDAADRLFPHFILIGLPVGLTGLVIAGLMAAAMSSLSSGLNSSSLVILNDFVLRFRKTSLAPRQEVTYARLISLAIGIVIVMLSLLVSRIQGNLMEVTYKTVNLLVAPLFVPFFMALFVRRSTEIGVFIGTLVSIAVAIFVGFSQEIFGRTVPFIWIVPAAFISGVLASWGLSLLEPVLKLP